MLPFGVVHAASFASADAEIVLRLDGMHQTGTNLPAELSIQGFGSRHVGTLSPAVYQSLNRVRVSGATVPNNSPVAMEPSPTPLMGDKLELDAQAGVRTNTLGPGQSAELAITILGAVQIVNANAFDVTIDFFYEREFILNTSLGDPLMESALARGEFSILGRSYDNLGGIADEFTRAFDQTVVAGDYQNPEEKFGFQFLVPAGGTASFDLSATAFSRVAVVPEPASLVPFTLGVLLMLGSKYGTRSRHR